MTKKKRKISELRRDIISGEWVVISPHRAKGKRPLDLIKKTERVRAPLNGCPFEDPQKSGNGTPLLVYPNSANREDWRFQIIENKYPAFEHRETCATETKLGPYTVMEGVGHHDLLITRDHDVNFPKLSDNEAVKLFELLQKHHLELASNPCTAYVSIFHNWGPKAGATVYHPHYQIMSIPVVPPDVHRSLIGSRRYFTEHKECVHCKVLEWELEQGTRVIAETEHVVAFTPFVSREPFEIRVLPKAHFPYFEDTPVEVLRDTALMLREVLAQMELRLKDPDYNFFIHSAPVLKKNTYDHYHWHVEILPKVSISAGFEVGTGIEVTVVDPDEAAEVLRC